LIATMGLVANAQRIQGQSTPIRGMVRPFQEFAARETSGASAHELTQRVGCDLCLNGSTASGHCFHSSLAPLTLVQLTRGSHAVEFGASLRTAAFGPQDMRESGDLLMWKRESILRFRLIRGLHDARLDT